VSNLACPKIQFIHGHGYVSVRDCIFNLLAHGRPINAFFSGMKIPSEYMLVSTIVSTTTGCFMLRKMLHRSQEKYPNENVLCLPLYEWGDDYDPSDSIKGGRASCHCKSIAISPPHWEHNSLDNTFILALSRKNQNHEPMEALFRDELLSLQDTLSENLFYWKEVGKDVKVYAELFVSLQDNPERCGSMFLTLGSGSFSSKSRHSCNYNAISDVLPSCHGCYTTNKGSIYIGQHTGEIIPAASFCNQCLNWDAGKDSELGYFKPHKNYPLSEDLIVGKYLKDKIETFEGLIRA
jgi:hypothetical protein